MTRQDRYSWQISRTTHYGRWFGLCVVLGSLFHLSKSIHRGDECGDWQSTENGNSVLFSPDYPNSVPNNLTCDWFVFINGSLSLEFRTLEFDLGLYDVLSVYHEPPGRGAIPVRRVSSLTRFSTDRNTWFQLISAGEFHENLTRRFRIEVEPSVIDTETCEDLRAPDNGQMLSSDFSFNSVVSFVCDSGFYLQGPQSVVCIRVSGSLEWSGVPPNCIAPCFYNKDQLGRNGSFYAIPDSVNVILSPNYPNYISGPVSCAWQITSHDGLNLTTEAFTPLNARFTIEVWANRITDFLDLRSSRHLLLNKTTFHEPLYVSGSHRTLVLILKLISESTSGKFVLNIERFNQTTCPPPPVSDYLTYHPIKTQYNLGEVVTYSCRRTFVFAEATNDTNFCSDDGHWSISKSVSLPFCSADCLTWSSSQQTYIPLIMTAPKGTLYSKAYPDVIPYGTCNYTFVAEKGKIFSFHLLPSNISSTEFRFIEPIGSSTFSAEWNSTLYLSKMNKIYLIVNQTSLMSRDMFVLGFQQETVDVNCPAPSSISDHLHAKEQNFSLGSTVNFYCDVSFDVLRVNESTCILGNRTAATWWPSLPVCLGSCGGVYESDNLTIVSPQFPLSYGSTEINTCVWTVTNTDDTPFEITVPVMNILFTDNLTVSDSDEITFLNYLCTVNCSWFKTVTASNRVTIEFTPSSEGRTTEEQLVFSIQLLSTGLTMCPAPRPVPNGAVIGNDFSEGSTVRFICHPPYDIEGAGFSTCLRSSEGTLTWDKPNPHCVIKDCTPPSTPVERTAGRGAIASPGYPGNVMTGGQECLWLIRASEDTQQLSLHFRYLDLPSEEDGGRPSSVLIIDVGANKNELLANFTADIAPRDVVSHTSAVRVEYYGPEESISGYLGLYLEYTVALDLSSTTSEPPSTWIKIPSTTFHTSPTSDIIASATAGSTTITTTKEAVSSEGLTEPYISTTAFTTPPDPMNPSSTQQTTSDLGKSRSKKTNAAGIVAGLLVPIAILISLVTGYVWYRKKYPVRMILGKQFGKFSNPIYQTGASTLTLVREDTPVKVQAS